MVGVVGSASRACVSDSSERRPSVSAGRVMMFFFAEAEEANGAVDGAVLLGAGEDADGGRAGEAVLLDVPVVACEQGVAGGCEAGGVCHLRSGDEGEAGGGGEMKKLLEPSACCFLDDGCCGGAGEETGVLIPCGGEPVGSESGGERAADDPTVEAASGGVDDAAVYA